MGGGMGVSKNKFIENWAYRRENAEMYFKFSRANWARLAVFGFAVPMALYKLIASEITSPQSVGRTFYTRDLNKSPSFLFHPDPNPPQQKKKEEEDAD